MAVKNRGEAARIRLSLRKFTTSMRPGLLIGDVGSTKSAWWADGAAPEEIRLAGYNPMQHEAAVGRSMLAALAARLAGLSVPATGIPGVNGAALATSSKRNAKPPV